MNGTTALAALRELAYRESDGLEVTLLWDEHRDELTVSVFDTKTGDFFAVEAPRDKALDVFYHPFSYPAARTGSYPEARLAA